MTLSLKKYLGIFLMSLSMTACADGVTVSDAYIRGLPPGQSVTAAFMTLNNSSERACRLVGASSAISSSAEIHAHSHHNGRMSMRPVDEVNIPAGNVVSLEPGGYHLMLFGLKHSLKEGDEHSITLFFEGCPELKVVAPVRSVLHEKDS
jgi:copper(I)-binding protein